MHELVFAEGYSDSLRRFEEQWHGKLYANGKARLRVREVKLYTLSINEAGRDEFLADLRNLTGSFDSGHMKDGPFTKWGLFTRLLRLIVGVFGARSVKDEDVKLASPGREAMGYVADKAILAHFIHVGEIKDGRYKEDGTEIV